MGCRRNDRASHATDLSGEQTDGGLSSFHWRKRALLSDYPTTRRRSGERGRNVTRNALSLSRFHLARVEKTDAAVARDLYSLELVLPETMRSISLLVLCKRQAVLSLDRSDTAALVTNIEMHDESSARGTDSRSVARA